MTSIVRFVDLAAGVARPGVLDEAGIHPVESVATLAELLRHPLAAIREQLEAARANPPVAGVPRLLSPIDGDTPVWGAGVTYRVSQEARVEESGDEDVYIRVYKAQRPELFLKCAAHEVVTEGEPVGRRPDSANDTPEPELALLLNAGGEIVAYGACNDMCARAIEGENPLYIPQAKIFAGSCVLAPAMRPAWEVPNPYGLTIRLRLSRGADVLFAGSTSTSELARTLEELVECLFCAVAFPDGAVLSTGTCLVPPLDCPSEVGDVIEIAIDDIASMRNVVTSTDDIKPWLHRRHADPLAAFGG
ncbi:MAG: fumarylacetoacetate hydrolase family protein [bacterium]|nr:fumarylacetoacetate hydrolase family protein [bacterium]